MIRSVRTAAAAVASTAVAAAGLVFGTAGSAHATGHGEGYYGVWASGVNVRAGGGEQCYLYPSAANCPTVQTTVSSPAQVWVYCQQEGAQSVGGNPYWVWVLTASGHRGYMASYYTDNATNWIDGVPSC
ncbi:hypothetical protein GCM10010220_12310 [Streptomyces parvulus]|uniref:Uncharacterized protein n=1 Tax=Streptomyces parvulus TaxID=146923 RepID=A0A191UTS1_9ACTN|nr:hypothetical protein [Streptomyces sp. SID5606]ANJ06098.1 hypothetical protein Spa2297_03330 [Streptomyces parvulus]MZD56013.1 hypothetical protein [Streptomyces sp. SID5606]GGR62843.1 hypothetical protein GCM10010220_12310 [Streptomyces parvulus]